jgi:predicted GIY-YIG superfamily endonuclease
MPCKKCGLVGHYSKTCKKIIENITDELIVGQDEEKCCTSVEKKKKEEKPKKYYCYILQQKDNPRSLNYIGYTVNYTRRLRQHNGDLMGGAFFTKNRGPWEFLCVLSCPSWNNIRAMQVECLAKHPTRTRKTPRCFYGCLGRINSLIEIFNRIPVEEEISIYIHDSFYSYAQNLNLPRNVKIYDELSGINMNDSTII